MYELEVLEREIKRTNGILTKRNAELYDSLQELKRKYTKLEESNLSLMKDNTKLYRKIRLSKLQIKNSNPQSQTHHRLETLAEVSMNLYDLEATSDSTAIPNPIQVTKTPKEQHGRFKALR